MRHELLMTLKRMESIFKGGACNRGLVWATACATIQSSTQLKGWEKRNMIARWDRMAGFG